MLYRFVPFTYLEMKVEEITFKGYFLNLAPGEDRKPYENAARKYLEINSVLPHEPIGIGYFILEKRDDGWDYMTIGIWSKEGSLDLIFGLRTNKVFDFKTVSHIGQSVNNVSWNACGIVAWELEQMAHHVLMKEKPNIDRYLKASMRDDEV